MRLNCIRWCPLCCRVQHQTHTSNEGLAEGQLSGIGSIAGYFKIDEFLAEYLIRRQRSQQSQFFSGNFQSDEFQLSNSSTIPQTMASVVSMREAMEEAFCSAVRVTLVGSMTPALTRSSYC